MEKQIPSKSNSVIAEALIAYAFRIGAIEFLPEGRLLRSGRLSPYFFNSGLFCTGDSIAKLARCYGAKIADEKINPEVIFGPAYKGIPLAATITAALGGDIGYAYNRKEAKAHGEGGCTVGTQLKGKRVLIVDDVITTGGSFGEIVEIIHEHGGIPVGCMIAFDRQERIGDNALPTLSAAQEFEENYNIPVRAVATLADLISFMRKITTGRYEDSITRGRMLGQILAYKEMYGAL